MIDAYRCGPLLGSAARLLAVPAPVSAPVSAPVPAPAHLSVLSAPRLLILLALALALLAPGAALQAAKGLESERLDLICREQPVRTVTFGEPGELSYDEQAPKESDPIEVRVTKSSPGEDFNYDFAIIESSADDIETDEAIWLGDLQIEAQQGRFKINLSNLVMTLTETDPDGNARFRRFDCEQRSAEETVSASE